jgi:general stress protein YciG
MSNTKEQISCQEAGKRGGNVTKARYGNDYYKEISKKGGQRIKELIEAGKRAESGE